MTNSSPPPGARIAVVTVSYGSADVLPAFLDSLSAASTQPIEALVADNKAGSDEDVAALVTAHGARHVALPTNVGYGAAVNAAVASVAPSVEWILVSNPDLVMSAGAIDTLVATGEEDPRIGAVGPATLTAEGELYPSARAVPSLRTGVGHALFANLWNGNPWTRAYRDDTVSGSERSDAGWLSGSCLLVRRSAWEAVGGFDPAFFMYFEDVDLGYRLGRHGFRNVYEPAAVVTHTGAHSTTGESAAMIEAHHVSARRFLDKKYSGALLWPVRISLRCGLAVRSALIKRRIQRG
ncbi:glycosyltransferase family 2 protein [Salinibacterium sp. SYSU T00001]|uniref:glycosyltransferase family 2 protein n=1 Tax=Homoserinimonas sedimenticola TaxID=2986805 RepID=UPI0022361ED0|nr:glycosyltransferase family 2 protein [Salinibacterium sedimenticola]MCW4385054.1 glycosyltransferase family 2 protein [Salinibacterium sedimenticola]